MNIVIEDGATGKSYMISGHGLDFEIFKESKGKVVDGKKVGEGKWTSCRTYPSELQYAVGKVLHWILADPDDQETVCTTAKRAVSEIRKAINERAKEITVKIEEEIVDD